MGARATIGVVAALMALLVFGVAGANAAPAITVQNNAPEGPGSLRQAIVEIDAGGTITVPSSVGAISLGGTQLEPERSMTIVGSGSTRPQINAEGKVRVLRIRKDANVTLSGLVLENGKMEAPNAIEEGGAGVLVEAGSLEMVNCLVVSNTIDARGGPEHGVAVGGGVAGLGAAKSIVLRNTVVADNQVLGGNGGSGLGGGVYANGPSLTIEGGSVKGNTAKGANTDGGGIAYRAGASLRLSHVAVTGNLLQPESSGNTQPLGGGIWMIAGTNTIEAVTVSGNQALGDSPTGMNVAAAGGGIYAGAPTTRFVNVTVTGNLASANVEFRGHAVGGGILSGGKGNTILNSTISGNSVRAGGSQPAAEGGDLYSIETTAMQNSIVAEGTGLSGAQNCAFEAGGIVSGGGNLDSGNTCGLKGPGDLVNTNAALRPLAENGGGELQTMALQPGSPAIGVGRGCPSTDARGVLRPATGCDAGAYEVATPSAATGGASGVGQGGATLTGTATNPDLAGGVVYFEYGTTVGYGARTAEQAIAATAPNVGFAAAVSGLSAATTYHYREVIRNALGTVAGADRTFTTLSSPRTAAAKRAVLSAKYLGGLRFRLHCTKVAPCRASLVGRAEVGKKSKVVAKAKARLAAGAGRKVTLKLTGVGRGLAKGGSAKVVVRIAVAEPGGKPARLKPFHLRLGGTRG